MNNIDFIVFKFYIPMYGSGLFYFDRGGEAAFKGIPEGTGEVIEDTVEISSDTFEKIYEYASKELSYDNNPDEYFGCSIEFYSGDDLIDSYDEKRINYEKYTNILYGIVYEYTNELSHYLW